jgi:hypothetical protein
MAERISYLHGGKATPRPEPVQVGDVVKTGPNDYPRFKVIAIDGERAWLRNVISGDDAVVSLTDCCWRVDETQKQDQRIGRMLRGGEPQPPRTGPDAPVEPPRIDRIFEGSEPSAPAPQGS